MNNQLLLLHCLSPMHAGVGQGTDVVDLAIARERATGFPYLPGSSLKGSLRALSELSKDQERTTQIFGEPSDVEKDRAGAVAFGDANLVCLPIRSVRGTFAYVTSPYLLERLARDFEQIGRDFPKWPNITDASKVRVHSDSILLYEQRVYFEDLDFDNEGPLDGVADALAPALFPDRKNQQELFKKRLCIVHDDVMRFLATHATDVVTRVKLKNDTKTADPGQLWTEENLPTDTILSSLLVHLPHSRKQNDGESVFNEISSLTASELQLGGKSTVGRGRTKGILVGGKA